MAQQLKKITTVTEILSKSAPNRGKAARNKVAKNILYCRQLFWYTGTTDLLRRWAESRISDKNVASQMCLDFASISNN